YQQMIQRLHLPLVQEPVTERPAPSELREGSRLRVQWSDGWWKAEVSEVTPEKVKVTFDTWGREHDEWIARDSQRLRWALPTDQRAAAEDGIAAPASTRDRAYVPKPFNPEKEFQKRQLRVREKIAAMQKTKLGFVDAPLAAKMDLKGEAMPPTGNAQLQRVSVEKAAFDSSRVQEAEKAVLTPAEAPPPPPLDHWTPPEPDEPPPAEKQESTPSFQARDPAPAEQVEVKQEMPPAKATATVSAVRWEELLTEQQERYYHEVATGRSQWDLPSEGWVALLDDDGTKYYWDPVAGTTQWDPPS
ncbi:Hypothetical protein (Fragment), partial [Durusdinium trenchii]